MPEPRLTTCGKQILLDGEHLADARDTLAAEVIAACLRYGNLVLTTPLVERAKVEEFFA